MRQSRRRKGGGDGGGGGDQFQCATGRGDSARAAYFVDCECKQRQRAHGGQLRGRGPATVARMWMPPAGPVRAVWILNGAQATRRAQFVRTARPVNTRSDVLSRRPPVQSTRRCVRFKCELASNRHRLVLSRPPRDCCSHCE